MPPLRPGFHGISSRSAGTCQTPAAIPECCRGEKGSHIGTKNCGTQESPGPRGAMTHADEMGACTLNRTLAFDPCQQVQQPLPPRRVVPSLVEISGGPNRTFD